MKNKYVKEFIKRGLIFSSLGPIVLGIVLMILGFCHVELKLEGWQIFIAILSTSLLAFIQAGSSVFEQVEEWSPFKAALIHMFTIYVIYLVTYLVNNWIPLNWIAIVIFSACVIATFILIWVICYFVSKGEKRKLDTLFK